MSTFLQSATSALASAGVGQTLVLVDEPSPPPWLQRSLPSLEVVSSPGAHTRMRTWWKAMRTLQETVAHKPDASVHLHGLLPSMFGARALGCAAFQARLYYSLHGTRAIAPWSHLAAVPLWMLSRKSERQQVRMMSSPHAEDHPPAWLERHALEFIETPVEQVFLDAERTETRHPLLISGARVDSKGAVAEYARLAVLLGGDELRLSCHWYGDAAGEDAALLKAAGIRTPPRSTDAQRASGLASAWMYLSLDKGYGFARDIAQAMAAGLPCVALDTRSNRHLINHGVTGFLCADRIQVMRRIAELIDDPNLRNRMGHAARESAKRRFTEDRFQHTLLKAYGLSNVAA